MKKSTLLILSIMMLLRLTAQWKGTGEQYYSISSASPAINLSTLVSIQTQGNWCAELRHNYDADRSFSMNAGRAFSTQRSFSVTFKPMLGVTVGSFKGINLNLNHDAEWKQLFYCAKVQYTLSLSNTCENFFYTWLETGYNFSDRFYSGISIQVSFPEGEEREISKGFFLGFSAGNWSFPVYFFDPFSERRSFITGIIFNMKSKKE